MGFSLERDKSEQWISGNDAIDNTVEAMRDNLRDQGVEDGELLESIVMNERTKMQDELSRNIEGDFSDPYEMPNFKDIVNEFGASDIETEEVDTLFIEELSTAEVDAVCDEFNSDI